MKLQFDILLKDTGNVEDRGYMDAYIERVFGVSTQRVRKLRPVLPELYSGVLHPQQPVSIPCIRFTIDGSSRLNKEQQKLLDHGGYDVTVINEE